MARQTIRLETDWEGEEWLDALDGTAAGCWPRLLCRVKAYGVRGRYERPATEYLARKWRVPESAVLALEAAALKAKTLELDGEMWVVADWSRYSGSDPRAAERMRRSRARRDAEPQREAERAPPPPPEPPAAPPPEPPQPAKPKKERKPREPKAPPPEWHALSIEPWIEHMGGTAPGGRIISALRPLVNKYGAEEVLHFWGRYLRKMVQGGRATFANPNDFATRYGQHKMSGGATGAGNGKTQEAADERLFRNRMALETVNLDD